MESTTDVKNNNDVDNLVCYLVKLLNKILVVQTVKGGHFSAKLVAVQGSKLFFENKAGETFIDNLDDVRTVREVVV